MPDYESSMDKVPQAKSLREMEPTYRIRIDSNGAIFHKNQLITRDELVAEIRPNPSIDNPSLLVEGHADVQVSTIANLQSYLTDAIPDIGTITYIVVREPADG
jgi:biopolymer transport protein ExbD